jgi:hypothetical protein
MDSSEIKDEFFVNEDPDVIIPREGEDVVSSNVVGEAGGEFTGEVEVVSRATKVSKSKTVNGEEGRVVISEKPILVTNQINRDGDFNVDTLGGSVPFSDIVGAASDTESSWDGFSISVESAVDKSIDTSNNS